MCSLPTAIAVPALTTASLPSSATAAAVASSSLASFSQTVVVATAVKLKLPRPPRPARPAPSPAASSGTAAAAAASPGHGTDGVPNGAIKPVISQAILHRTDEYHAPFSIPAAEWSQRHICHPAIFRRTPDAAASSTTHWLWSAEQQATLDRLFAPGWKDDPDHPFRELTGTVRPSSSQMTASRSWQRNVSLGTVLKDAFICRGSQRSFVFCDVSLARGLQQPAPAPVPPAAEAVRSIAFGPKLFQHHNLLQLPGVECTLPNHDHSMLQLLLGTRGSFTPVHTDWYGCDAYLQLQQGEKIWYLAPPEKEEVMRQLFEGDGLMPAEPQTPEKSATMGKQRNDSIEISMLLEAAAKEAALSSAAAASSSSSAAAAAAASSSSAAASSASGTSPPQRKTAKKSVAVTKSSRTNTDEMILNGIHAVHQKEGDIIYVPGGWVHAVKNLTNTVAFGNSYLRSWNLPRTLAYMQDPERLLTLADNPINLPSVFDALTPTFALPAFIDSIREEWEASPAYKAMVPRANQKKKSRKKAKASASSSASANVAKQSASKRKRSDLERE